MMKKRRPLKMVDNDGWFAGVCGGIAYAYGWPVTIVRIFFFLFALVLSNKWTGYVGQPLLWFYIIFWIFGPEWDKDPKDYHARTV